MTPRDRLLREACRALRRVSAVMERVLKESAAPVDEPATLTANEVAAELKVSGTQVRAHLRRGALRGYRIGSRGWRVERADLDSFKRNRANRRTA